MTHSRRDGRPTCNAQVGWHSPNPDALVYREQPAYCRQVVGLTAYTAPDGTVVRYCGATGHRARVERQTLRQHAAV